jgi:hypothetical protein
MIGRKGSIDIVSHAIARWFFTRLLLASVVLTLISGCNRNDEIKVYRIAKAPLDATPSTDAAMPTNASSPSSLPGAAPVTPTAATIPSDWEPQPLSQMRQASFLVHGENGAVADISFVTLGPSAGNILDNVNRWLSQLAQPPITADKLADAIERLLPTARGDVAIVDLTGQPENSDASKDGRIIGAIASEEGKTAFYKMRGNPSLVGTEKANFLKWVSSVRDAAVTANTASSEKTSEKPQIKWDVPQGWSPAPASVMRYASFTVTGESGDKIDISVVTFPGDGGSDAENVNRWRQQIGLPAADASTLKSAIVPVKSGDTDFPSIDMTGTKSRVLAAWARRDGRTWFFKLTGPNAVVEKEKPKFVKFLQSVRF